MQNSHFSASIAAPKTFNYDNPPTAAFRIDPKRLESQFHIHNEPDGFDRLNSSFGVPPTPIERESYIRKYVDVKYTDGSNDKMWSSWDFPWTKKLEANNKKVFGNHSFRPNQREVINATMSIHDVFVLMPSGGGKSLTYQSSGTGALEKSDVLLRHLEILYARESLDRIVIDEAHCVSQWGHDFRPDYQGLGILKQMFPRTPVLVLTATTTTSVKEDAMQALGLIDCIIFRQSLNRPNLQWKRSRRSLNMLLS